MTGAGDGADAVRGGASGSLSDGVRLSLGTLTAFPTSPPQVVDRRSSRIAMALAWLPGLALGVVAAGVGVLAVRFGVPPLVAAVLAVGALQWSCRGFHLDGLGDTADGLAAGPDRDRMLRVMKSGDSGPAAVATSLLVLLAQVAALAAVLAGPWVGAAAGVVVVVTWSRAFLVLPCVTGLPPARADGLGVGVVGSVPVLVAGRVVVLVGTVGAVLLAVTGWPWWSGPLLVGVCLAVLGWLVWHVIRRLGGITGDVLGASVEVGLTVLLVVLSALA